ncbi:hypothetical protein AHiyo1_01120 [Arthrobacter sp. Hiyo1]|nr:hypothetical protein AHiyo1_01120 [Arthrobacter sp. Hiyo1]
MDGGRQLPCLPPDSDAYRDLGPDLAPRTGRADRPHERCRSAVVRRGRIHGAGLRNQGPRWRAADSHRFPRPPRPRGPEQRREDASPRIQLRRRFGRARPPRCRPVLHRLRQGPADALRAHADDDGKERQAGPGVPQAHGLRPVRGAPGIKAGGFIGEGLFA